MATSISFHHVLFDPDLVAAAEGQRFPVTGSPRLANTVIFNEKTGIAKTNINRFDEVRYITLKIALATAQKSSYFNEFWLGGWGSGFGFRLRYVPDYIATQEAFAAPGGTQPPDGSRTQFKLYKSSSRPGASDVNSRRIYMPVAPASKETNGFALSEPNGASDREITTTFRIYFNTGGGNVEQASGWTVNVKTGVVTFTSPPAAGTTLLWSGEFDTPVAFLDNSYEHSFDVPSEIDGIRLREILGPELGIE